MHRDQWRTPDPNRRDLAMPTHTPVRPSRCFASIRSRRENRSAFGSATPGSVPNPARTGEDRHRIGYQLAGAVISRLDHRD